ncbi:hypothetical protein AOQ84DRAFT_347890 [Glonium stellatum]|uniref:Organic solute transporter Ostalpha-domain-containing protein n=1 Tax=Glonium stellatum TaxID=574774 RepID=A0A8E2ERG2_9PEZI|nr:hypothetical protein AOQ84DRAFT_347890 [Glonium stellatum]
METMSVARGLFRHDSGSLSNRTCPHPDESGPTIVPLVGSMSFHKFSMILSGACGVFVLVLCLYSVFSHAMKYSRPVQQRQLIRIVCLVPWVSIISFLSIWLETAGPYIAPAIDFGAALALSAFLLLLCDYVLAGPNGSNDLLGLEAPDRGQNAGRGPQWLKKTWYLVLQFIPVTMILWIATAASLAVGTYCATSNKPYFAHIWITIFRLISTTLAIIAILKFYGRQKSQLSHYNVMLKLLAFKSIIFLNVSQGFILNLLISSNIIKPNKYLSYHDATVAIPSLVLSCEMPFFAVLMIFAYNTKPYTVDNADYVGGPLGLGAIFQALNMTDILSAFVRGPMRLLRGQEKDIGTLNGNFESIVHSPNIKTVA